MRRPPSGRATVHLIPSQGNLIGCTGHGNALIKGPLPTFVEQPLENFGRETDNDVLIREFLNAENEPAITSDLWHVVLAEWSRDPGIPSFVRTIVNEHDCASALRSAQLLKAELVVKMKQRERETRDQVMVKRPMAESLKNAGRLVKRPG
jgi:hypothetical protein